jgi:hypothetical protein
MAFASIDFSQRRAMFASSHWSCLNRVAFDDGSTGFWVPLHLLTHVMAQAGHDRFPDALLHPHLEIVIDCLAIG